MKYFDHEYRVIYRDTDKMGITYYANYLVWFEAARTEYFRAAGYLYSDCEKKGLFLPAIEAGIKYLAPSYYDDVVVIRTSVSILKISAMRFDYQVSNKETGKHLAYGHTLHAFVDHNMQPVRVPDEVRHLIEPYNLLQKEIFRKN